MHIQPLYYYMNKTNDRLNKALELANTLIDSRERGSYIEHQNERAAYADSMDSPSVHPLYFVLMGMINRCTNPKNKSFRWYGAKGITVCDEWLSDHKAFVLWGSANGWQPRLQIHREDHDKGYCPSNCMFITQWDHTQNRKPESERVPEPDSCDDESKHYCAQCRQWLDPDAFYDLKSNGSTCKECRRKHRRKSYVSVRKIPLLTEKEKKVRYNAYHREYKRRQRAKP